MTAIQKFTEKYGISPLKLVEDTHLKYLGFIKSNGLIRALENFVEDEKLNIEIDSEFEKNLVEAFAEAGERFPENGKISELEGNVLLSIPSVNAGVPKSKGTLENFKEIVGRDELRPAMSGVFVSEDGASLVGTDAHKLVVQKSSEYSEYAGKIIDLKVYLQTKGKKLSFIDGKYPNYKAILPQDSPNEVKNFDTYALYNFAKSTIAVHKLVNQTMFNINLKLPSNGSEGTINASFNPVLAVDLLVFALANGWSKFTLEYSEISRAFILNFGDGNTGLLMPILNREGGEFVLRGSEVMTPEEIMEKYKLSKGAKISKPTAKKTVTPSAPVSSEPFKKFEGDYDEDDTTYVHRREIESITLANGEVLGKNDVVHGFYRVKKKMAHGGGVGEHKNTPYRGKIELKKGDKIKINTPHNKNLTITIIGRRGDGYDYISSSAQSQPSWQTGGWFDMMIQKPNAELIRYPHGGSMYAEGGGIEGLKVGSKVGFLRPRTGKYEWAEVLSIDGDNVNLVVRHPKRKEWDNYFTETKQRIEKYTNTVDENWHDSKSRTTMKIKYEHGGSMYADGGEMPTSPFLIEIQPLFSGEEPLIVRISPDSVNGFTAGYVMYESPTSTRKVGYLSVSEFKDKIKNKEYRILDESKMAMGGSMYADGGNMFETPIAKYKEVSGKVVGSVPVSEDVYSSQVKDFVDYVYEVYEEYGFTKKQVKEAVDKYIKELGYQFTWGGGDSLDKERVYEYLLNPTLKGIKNPSLGISSSMSSDFEVGDSVFYESENNPKLEPSVSRLFNKYANRELVIEKIELDTPFNTARAIDKATGEKLIFDLILNPDHIKKYSQNIIGKSGHAVGDTVTFNSVMGGTKTGEIVSTLGDDGYRIKTEDGFAMVKKSAIV
jgi:hypothetical protein